MRILPEVIVVSSLIAATVGSGIGCADGGDDEPSDDSGTGTDAREDAGTEPDDDAGGDADADAAGDTEAGGETGADGAPEADAAGEVDAEVPPLMLFQCQGIAGGICSMRADGSERRELLGTGRDPAPEPGGAVLFHTDGYRVNRLRPDETVEDLGEGAFAQPAPGGGILFQCSGLGGGLCRMNSDGSGREVLRASGRAPVPGPGDAILFHGDDYRVRRRLPDGSIEELGDGAFPHPLPDGRIVFQCSGLGGGLCRMSSDGSGREELRAGGREPAAHPSGLLGFHTDSYDILVREPDGDERNLGAGRAVAWTP